MLVSTVLLDKEILLACCKVLPVTIQRDQFFSSIQLLHTNFIQTTLEPQSKVPKSGYCIQNSLSTQNHIIYH